MRNNMAGACEYHLYHYYHYNCYYQWHNSSNNDIMCGKKNMAGAWGMLLLLVM